MEHTCVLLGSNKYYNIIVMRKISFRLWMENYQFAKYVGMDKPCQMPVKRSKYSNQLYPEINLIAQIYINMNELS